nr:MAG TPA: hypothetical protein [Bacteriophage sp.]
MVRRQAYGLKTFGLCLWVRFPPTQGVHALCVVQIHTTSILKIAISKVLVA